MAAPRGASGPDRKVGELERLGPDGADYLVLGLDAPGFEDLDPPRRALCYFLYRAAVAGDRIFTEQNHRHATEIVEWFESIHLRSDGLDPAVRRAAGDYLKRLWINHGHYEHDTHVKFVPGDLTPSMLERAARHAAAPGEDVEGKLARLAPHIFDPDVEPILLEQKEGLDILAASCVNLYAPGMTTPLLETVPAEWKERLNVRFDLRDGRVVPEPYRIGGVHGRDLETIAHFLRGAAALAESDEQRAGLLCLVEYYATGDEERYRRHAAHWLRSSTTVDYLNGFVEQYTDPRGVIGQFEANVSIAADSDLIGRLADSALYFERRMPWPDRYKRDRLDRPVARVVNVLVETGDAGPMSPAAYNLPNYADLRASHGSRNVVLSNIEEARSKEIHEAVVEEFYLPRYRDVARRFFDEGRRWIVYMHEVIGHGSGLTEPDLGADPRSLIGRAYSSLEECRADLVALYHIFDERLVEIGAFTRQRRDAVIEAAWIGYFQGHVVRYRSIPEDTVREAHRRGAELVLQYLTRGGEGGDRDFGVKIVIESGDYFVAIEDLGRAREGVAELLGTIQTIKSRGDARRAADLFDRFGTRLDPAIRANITRRAARLRIPRVTAFVFPRLDPVLRDGEVVDATIHFDEDLAAQQIRIARSRHSTAIP